MESNTTGLINYRTLLGLGLLIGGAGSLPLGFSKETPEGNEKVARVSQATDLLGGAYEKRIGAIDDNSSELHRFVYSYALRQLPSKYKNQAEAVTRSILAESNRYGFDPIFLMAVMKHESRFSPGALGHHGEIGMMQIKPSTAAWIVSKVHLPIEGRRPASAKQTVNAEMRRLLLNPETNIRIGAAYLAMLRNRFERRGHFYLAAYNMGASKLVNAVIHNEFPKVYATKVLAQYVSIYRAYRRATRPEFQLWPKTLAFAQ